jgi:hypothetical protein
MGISKIEVSFPAPVNLPDGWEQALCSLVEIVCKQWQAENPTMVMWTAGIGSKVTRMPIAAGDERMEFDDDTFAIDCCAREDYYGENPANPDGPELKRRNHIEWSVRKGKPVETLINGVWIDAEVKPPPFAFEWDKYDYRLPVHQSEKTT